MFIKDNFISLVAFILACYFLASAIVIHIIHSDLDFISNTLSQYALGRYGMILQAGFVAIGISQALLAWLVLANFSQRTLVMGGVFLLLAAIGVLIVATFPVQPREVGMIARLPHVIGAVMQFLFFPVALLMFASMMNTGNMRIYTFISGNITAFLFIVTLVLFLIDQKTDVPILGVVEKIDIIVITLWVIVAAYHLYRPSYLTICSISIENNGTGF